MKITTWLKHNAWPDSFSSESKLAFFVGALAGFALGVCIGGVAVIHETSKKDAEFLTFVKAISSDQNQNYWSNDNRSLLNEIQAYDRAHPERWTNAAGTVLGLGGTNGHGF